MDENETRALLQIEIVVEETGTRFIVGVFVKVFLNERLVPNKIRIHHAIYLFNSKQAA